jgi:hypothetical protein
MAVRAGFRQRGDLCFVEHHAAAGEAVAHRPPSDGPLALTVKLRALASEPFLHEGVPGGDQGERRDHVEPPPASATQAMLNSSPICLPRKGKAQLLADPLHLLSVRERGASTARRAWARTHRSLLQKEGQQDRCRRVNAAIRAFTRRKIARGRQVAARATRAQRQRERGRACVRTAERHTPRTVEA